MHMRRRPVLDDVQQLRTEMEVGMEIEVAVKRSAICRQAVGVCFVLSTQVRYFSTVVL